MVDVHLPRSFPPCWGSARPNTVSVGFEVGLSELDVVFVPKVPMCPCRELVGNALKVDVKCLEVYVGSCEISLLCSLIFGVPWLGNKRGGLRLGKMLKPRGECGKD